MLNEQQQKVVDYEKSLINIAGPGSGKTHTLISKISNIIENNQEIINNMLVLTFTNSAAKEIRDRALKNIDFNNNLKTSNLFFGTYHSMFKRILKENKIFERLDLGVNPTITTPNETLRYITNKIKNDYIENYNDISELSVEMYYENSGAKIPAKPTFNKTILKKELIDGQKILNSIENSINKLTIKQLSNSKNIKESYKIIEEETIETLMLEISKTNEKITEDKEIMNKKTLQEQNEIDKFLYNSITFGSSFYDAIINNMTDINKIEKQLRNYIKELFEMKFNQKIIGFGDIMILTLHSLCKFDTFKKEIQNKFQYIFVDEFQDTNIIQGEILFLIYKKDNICVIGDPYQSIYGFLGAKIENILKASKTFNAKTIQLIENYRSNQNIVDLTNHLGVNMLEKIDNWKPCVSSNTQVKNNKIQLINNMTDEGQTKFIIEKIKEYSPSTKIGIINRNGNVYMLEAALTKSQLRYKKLGGISLGESVEIKSLISLFIYIFDNNKINSLVQVLDNLTGIGAKSIEKYEKDHEEFLKNNQFKVKNSKKIDLAIKEMQNILGIEQKENYQYELSKKELNEIELKIKDYYYKEIFPNISKSWKQERLNEANTKIEVLFEEIKEQEDIQMIIILLEDYILGSKEKNSGTEKEENITVTTIHSAKGLEWDVVILMNWDNNIFERDNIKEAQRLSYVSVSRAKEDLIIISTENNFYQISNNFIETNKEIFQIISEDEKRGPLKLKFGKYKGSLLEDIPYNYLEWILDNKIDLMGKGLIDNYIVEGIENI